MRLEGLYLVTPDWDDTESLCRVTEQALAAGASTVQYRHKHAPAPLALEQASRLARLCARFGRPLIVNDSVELMEAVDAAGVHLGRDDGDPRQIRQRIGPSKLLGVSCYDDLDLALGYREVADHVAFGSVFLSGTKPQAIRAPLGLFDQARAAGLNTVAIGGIDAGNAAAVFEAGADAVAVIGGVYAAADPAGAARRIVSAFSARARGGAA